MKRTPAQAKRPRETTKTPAIRTSQRRSPAPALSDAAFASSSVRGPGERGAHVVAVEPRDPLHADLLGTGRLALEMVRAGPEAFLVHLRDHLQRARFALGLALGQQSQVRELGRREEHGGGVGAG